MLEMNVLKGKNIKKIMDRIDKPHPNPCVSHADITTITQTRLRKRAVTQYCIFLAFIIHHLLNYRLHSCNYLPKAF